MLKKLKKFLKFSIIGIIWTYIYVSFFHFLILKVWNFEIFSPQHWEMIGSYWNKGGKIKSGTDYAFSFTLIALIPLWIWGFRKLYKADLVKVILFPIVWLNKRAIEKASKNIPRTVLKNIGVHQEIDINKMVDKKLAAQISNEKEPASIRQTIQDKISGTKK